MTSKERASMVPTLPPNLSTTELAVRLEMVRAAAHAFARRHGYAFRRSAPETLAARRLYRYADWDWSQSNADLARAHGVTRQAVAQIRLKLERQGAVPVVPRCHVRGGSKKKVLTTAAQ